MKKNKKVSALQQEYKKQIRRIKSFIRNAEKRGYRFEKNILPEKPKRITKASVNRLKDIKPITLYKKSTYLSESGTIIKGTEGRKEERKIAAKKGKKTRELRKRAIEQQPAYIGDLILQSIQEMIDSVKRDHRKAGDSLQRLLENEINQYGKEAVARSLSNTPQEAIELAQLAINYNPGDTRHDGAIRELEMIITGTIPTAEELRILQDNIDEDEYTDYV